MLSSDALIRRASSPPLPNVRRRRSLRRKAGITQQQVADAIGVTREAVSRWESGVRSPREPHRSAYLVLLHELEGIGR